ncbi:MAG TPA: nucleotidyltransferase family protein [Chitinophagaceae bacterium]
MSIAVTNKESLIRQIIAHRRQIRSYGVKSLGLFGSFSKQVAIHDGSDIDFLVDFETGKKTYDNFMDLGFYLEELLGRKIDLVTPQSLSKYIGPYILNEVENVGL